MLGAKGFNNTVSLFQSHRLRRMARRCVRPVEQSRFDLEDGTTKHRPILCRPEESHGEQPARAATPHWPGNVTLTPDGTKIAVADAQ